MMNLDKPMLDSLFQWGRAMNAWKPVTLNLTGDDQGRIVCTVHNRDLFTNEVNPTVVAQSHIGYATKK